MSQDDLDLISGKEPSGAGVFAEPEMEVRIADAGELPPVGGLVGLLPHLPEAQPVKDVRVGKVSLIVTDATLGRQEVRAGWQVGAIRKVNRLDDLADEGCCDGSACLVRFRSQLGHAPLTDVSAHALRLFDKTVQLFQLRQTLFPGPPSFSYQDLVSLLPQDLLKLRVKCQIIETICGEVTGRVY